MDEFYRLPVPGNVYTNMTPQMHPQMYPHQMQMPGMLPVQHPSTTQHTMPILPHTDELHSTVHAQFHQTPGVVRLEREIQVLQRQVNALDRRVDRLERRLGQHY